MKRFLRARRIVCGVLLVAIVGMLVLSIQTTASAQIAIDPTTQVQQFVADNNWLAQAQGWAWRIYTFLLVFELIALAVTALLFRENVGEFLASISLKIFLGSVFMWFVVNAGTWAPQVIATFTGFGKALGGQSDPTQFVSLVVASAIGMYATAGAAQAADAIASNVASIPCVWTAPAGVTVCPIGTLNSIANSHQQFVLLANGVAFMLMMAAAVVLLSFLLITIESYIVMSAGVLFIGFAGSRFTSQFSQGYFSYMINVGTKLMVLYIMLGIAMPFVKTILAATIIAAATCCVPDGGSLAVVATGAALWAAFECMVISAMIALVPGIAGSLLTGSSSASGSQMLQSAIGQMNAARQFQGQMDFARQAASGSPQAHNTMHNLQRAGGGETASSPASSSYPGDMNTGAAGPQQSQFIPAEQNPDAPNYGAFQTGAWAASAAPSGRNAEAGGLPAPQLSPINAVGGSNGGAQLPPQQVQPAIPQSGPPVMEPVASAYLSGTAQQNALNNNNAIANASGASPASGSTGDKPLYAYSQTERDRMPPAEIARLLQEHPSNEWSDDQRQKVYDQNPLIESIDRAQAERSLETSKASQEVAEGYALGALAAGVPRDVGQPTAVQVRIGNPDRL
jgi:type IV secretion system protein TrbL